MKKIILFIIFWPLIFQCCKKDNEYVYININRVNGGHVQVYPSNWRYEKGEELKLVAIPFENFKFSHWEGAIDGDYNPCYITIDFDIEITPVFVEDLDDKNKI